MTLLSVQSVCKNFGGLRALNNVSLDVAAGSIHGLMGANGAGKTTLFSIVAGNQPASSGRVTLNGVDLLGMSPDKICKAGIARTFQIVRPFAGMTVRENIETAVLFGRAEAPAAGDVPDLVDEVLNDVGLADRADQPAGTLTLSGRKQLEVARALGTEPTLLMLDEVMAGLTPAEVDEMMAVLRRVKDKRGLTILIIEHVVSALSTLSDRITVLHHGEKIAEGSADDIANDETVQAAYFGVSDDDE